MRMISKDLVIGLDLGGTKILAALTTIDGEIIGEMEYETKSIAQRDTSANILFTINRMLEKSNIDRSRLKGIGVASAGVIDSEQNIIIYANNLGLENFPIGSLLENSFQIPVKLCNDANAAAVGEWIWGAGKGKQNLVYITVSTGVGAGIISNGSLMTGVNDSAGEFGHISISHNDVLCECGNRGCLEKFASGTAINKVANQRLKDGEISSLLNISNKGSDVTNKEIGLAAKSGDSFSINLLKEVGEYLGTGVINLIHLFNTEVIVFGGGVMNMSEFILPSVKETATRYGIQKMVKDVDITKTVLGKNAGVMGASGLFFINEKDISTSTPITLKI